MKSEASPDWNVLLAPFQSLFTKSGFRYFCAFVRVLAHLDGRLWVTQVVLSQMRTRHWTNSYRFLRSPAWEVSRVAAQVFALCIPLCKDSEKRVFVALDDTVCRNTGKHFDSLGVPYDPMNKDHPKRLSHGHCFVVLAQTAGQRSVALFVSCAPYLKNTFSIL